MLFFSLVEPRRADELGGALDNPVVSILLFRFSDAKYWCLDKILQMSQGEYEITLPIEAQGRVYVEIATRNKGKLVLVAAGQLQQDRTYQPLRP